MVAWISILWTDLYFRLRQQLANELGMARNQRAPLFVATTTDPKITMTKLGWKDITDAHTGPGESEHEHN